MSGLIFLWQYTAQSGGGSGPFVGVLTPNDMPWLPTPLRPQFSTMRLAMLAVGAGSVR